MSHCCNCPIVEELNIKCQKFTFHDPQMNDIAWSSQVSLLKISHIPVAQYESLGNVFIKFCF